MLEPHELRDALIASFGGGVLAGLHIVVSAGPTHEDIDPVRFIGNRSSGKMGFAIAEAAAQAGAPVTLVAGPVSLPPPTGVAKRIDVRSPTQMLAAVQEAAHGAHIYIGAAAVGDYRPQQVAERKLKKQGEELLLRLTENADILATLAAQPQPPFLVGFAAETHDLAAYAQDKLRRKGLDMVAANRVGESLGFESADNALTLYWPGGEVELARAAKTVLARQLIEHVAVRYRLVRG
jgi:phosphopantothenoylcysteine decarboxylase/phosphopantothenate--cysteine ligase